MPISTLASITTFIVSIFLGLFIIYRDPKKLTNVTFGAFTICVAFWVITNFFTDIAKTTDVATFWARMTLAAPALMPFLLLMFSKVFPRQEATLNKGFWFLLLTPGLITLVLTPTVLNIEKVSFTATGQELVVGPLYTPFFIYFAIYLIGTFINLFKKFKRSTSLEKLQIQYLIFGLVTASIFALLLNVILPIFGLSNLVSLGAFSSVFIVGSTAYAIVKHRLLDIRLVVARTVAYSLLLVILSVFYIGSTVLLTNFLFKTTTSSAQLLLYSALTLVVAFTFQPLRSFLEKSTDKVFFKGDYDFNNLLSQLTKIIAETILIDDIANRLLTKLLADMRITRGAFVLTDQGKIFVSETQGYKEEPKFSEKDVFSLQALDKNLIFEELEEGSGKELMRKLNVTAVIPLKTQVDHVGLLLLGEKASGEIYSAKDIKVLEIFSPEAAISFENAKSVEKIRRFNITLKEQVDRATRELRSANEQLKDLDRLKDEFLSIASHDLRTPMTAIKGYLWMAINGRAGKIENQALKRYLDISYSSAERMIQLINDLLNVSRIKAGRVQMIFEEIDIKTIIDQVFAEIMSKVTEKNILLKYEGSANLPKLILDKQRFPEILQNLIGNALKFTPEKGKITVTAKRSKEEGFIEVAVTDTGVGLSKEDAGKLFEKYGRIETSYTKAKESGGTGLGLYITKTYVELHGGKIWVESEEGKGTSFIFTLHVADPEMIKKMNSDTQPKQVAPNVPQTNNSTVKEMVTSSTT